MRYSKTLARSHALAPGARPGFTLLEVILATTIFAITISALFVTFRTGIRAWETGHIASETFQTARIAKDVIVRDLHNIVYNFDLPPGQGGAQPEGYVVPPGESVTLPMPGDPGFPFPLPPGLEAWRRATFSAGSTESNYQGGGFSIQSLYRDPRNYNAGMLDPAFIADLDTNNDGVADIVIDFNQDGMPDVPVDTDGDGIIDTMVAGPPVFSPPIDLSMKGRDGADNPLIDEIEFARRVRPRSERELENLGLMRVRYYVTDGVLYREEFSSFQIGRSESESESNTTTNDPDANERASKLFYVPGEVGGGATYSFDDGFESAVVAPHVLANVAEPLCEGVEIFNITYGYYKFDQWNEAPDWDSDSFRYRFPAADRSGLSVGDLLDPRNRSMPAGANPGAFPESAYGPRRRAGRPRRSRSRGDDSENFIGRIDATLGRNLALMNENLVSFTVAPDGLPAYIAVQLGIRASRGKKVRIKSFTFFTSIPMSRELFDTTMIDETDRLDLLSRTPEEPPEFEIKKFWE